MERERKIGMSPKSADQINTVVLPMLDFPSSSEAQLRPELAEMRWSLVPHHVSRGFVD